MRRPFRTYGELVCAPDDALPRAIPGALRLLLVIGAAVSVTAAGRLAPIEMVVAMVSFAYVPAVQLFAVFVALRVARVQVAYERAFGLFLAGRGPWMTFLLVIAAIGLIAPSPASALLAALPPLLLVTLGWAVTLTYAFFRAGLATPRRRAILATTTYSAVLVLVVLGYYLAMGQLAPLVRSA